MVRQRSGEPLVRACTARHFTFGRCKEPAGHSYAHRYPTVEEAKQNDETERKAQELADEEKRAQQKERDEAKALKRLSKPPTQADGTKQANIDGDTDKEAQEQAKQADKEAREAVNKDRADEEEAREKANNEAREKDDKEDSDKNTQEVNEDTDEKGNEQGNEEVDATASTLDCIRPGDCLCKSSISLNDQAGKTFNSKGFCDYIFVARVISEGEVVFGVSNPQVQSAQYLGRVLGGKVGNCFIIFENFDVAKHIADHSLASGQTITNREDRPCFLSASALKSAASKADTYLRQRTCVTNSDAEPLARRAPRVIPREPCAYRDCKGQAPSAAVTECKDCILLFHNVGCASKEPLSRTGSCSRCAPPPKKRSRPSSGPSAVSKDDDEDPLDDPHTYTYVPVTAPPFNRGASKPAAFVDCNPVPAPGISELAAGLNALTGHMSLLAQSQKPASGAAGNITTEFATAMMTQMREACMQSDKERNRNAEEMAKIQHQHSLPAAVTPTAPAVTPTTPAAAPAAVASAETLADKVRRLKRDTALAELELTFEQQKRELMELMKQQ